MPIYKKRVDAPCAKTATTQHTTVLTDCTNPALIKHYRDVTRRMQIEGLFVLILLTIMVMLFAVTSLRAAVYEKQADHYRDKIAQLEVQLDAQRTRTLEALSEVGN